MKGSKEELAKYLTNKYTMYMRNKKKLKNYVDYVIGEGFPPIEVIDVVQMRTQAVECSERLLYYLFKAAKYTQENDENEEKDSRKVEDYFSDREIKEYETTKYKPLKFSFPIKWQMIEVSEGTQWIGKITVKELMRLRDAQLINYNERTQRTLKHVVNKDFEYYQIFLNRNAVDAITDSYLNGRYIPNTITLNLPEDAEFDYSDGTLTIREADKLDIIDGYHRYIAMSNIYNQNPKFNYTMELRVVCFNEDTARQFIWQEDQKTKMRRLDSDSFNQNSAASQVINLINQNSMYRNVIGRNNEPIDQGVASSLINLIWFKDAGVKVSRKKIREVADKIIFTFDEMIGDNEELFDKKWDYDFTVITFSLMKNEHITNMTYYEEVCMVRNAIRQQLEPETIIGRKGTPLRTQIITRVNKFFEAEIKKEV